MIGQTPKHSVSGTDPAPWSPAARVVASLNSPLHQLEREESRLAIRGNPQNGICKQTAARGPKTGKFDYLSAPGHSARSMASEFFTDDYLGWYGRRCGPDKLNLENCCRDKWIWRRPVRSLYVISL